MLALSWSPNADGSVWTFKLRPGVKFHNGAAMTADDVVYTLQQLSDPKNASNALSAFGGVLMPSGVKAVDPMTVAVHTSRRRTATFPTSCPLTTTTRSSCPRGPTSASGRARSSAPARSSSAATRTNVGATFVANPNYWGAPAAAVDDELQVLLEPGADDPGAPGQRRRRDRAVHARRSGRDPQQLPRTRSSSSRRPTTASCRCATTSRRSPIRACARRSRTRSTGPVPVAALLSGDGTVANDYPFGPRFPSTDPTVPQRTQNIAMAKQLLPPPDTRTGSPRRSITEIYQEIPRARAGDPGRRGQGGHQHQASTSPTRRCTTARARSATRTGSTAR